jgi:Cu(I)/Ag(I) efflux system membrane fusion protein
MKRTTLVVSLGMAGVLLATAGFLVGRSSGRNSSAMSAPASAASAGERKVLYWHDPMVPGPRFHKPGRSPFMDMQLVPVYADEVSDAGVKVSPAVQQNLGVRTAVVKKADVASSFDAVGTVQFDERLGVAVQTRVAGYVEHLAVRAPMERVRKGQPLATVYAPDWLAPQNEFLALKRAGVGAELVAAARDRMRAMSIPESLIRQSEETGVAHARFTFSAPVGGVVAELGVREGGAVSPGMTIFRIAGLEKVWAVAEVPEAQAVHLVRGRKVKAVLQVDASQTFDGELEEIIPQVSATTRTLQARFEVDNKAGKLSPGMLLRLQVAGASSSRLVMPSEAVIRTGTRAVAIVRKGSSFVPCDIQVGVDLGDQLEVLDGLHEGDEVVTSGQFLIDSEANLKSVLGAMGTARAASAPAAASAAATYHAQGKVESVDAASITVSHGPVPELKWPGMTMGFSKASPKAFSDIKLGDTVRFEFRKQGDGYELVSMQRAGVSK